jgi:hypothetical protein
MHRDGISSSNSNSNSLLSSFFVALHCRIAALHEEFASSFGNASAAKVYRARAATVESVLREKYWNGDHWWTNYPGLFKDESASPDLVYRALL